MKKNLTPNLQKTTLFVFKSKRNEGKSFTDPTGTVTTTAITTTTGIIGGR